MDEIDNKQTIRRWLFGALAVAGFYSALGLRLAFRLPDLVQDDARQHVFWMERFRDPTLFPNDLIADYFQAVAPAGYKAVYWIFAKFGVDPLFLSKILPAAIGIATAWLAFRFFVRLTGDARGAFFASVIICQLAWFKDDIVSATPRAFVYPLFLAFLLFLVERRTFACLLVLAAEGLVYPQAALVSLGVLGLDIFDWRKPYFLARDRNAWILAMGGAMVVAAVLTAFGSSVSRYGPVITRAEAQALPEFLQYGRSQFFAGGVGFWLTGARSGIWPGAIPGYLAILGLLGVGLLAFSKKLRGLKPLQIHRVVLLRVLIAALVTWAAAHVLLFKLHLPARYSQWPIRILLGATGAIAVMWIFMGLESLRERWPRLRMTAALLGGAVILVLTIAPVFARKFPSQTYIQARPRELFEFLERQPNNIVIATIRENASKIPVFAHRSVLVSAEHAIPYHTGYYFAIRERGRDLVNALLTPNREELRAFIEKYHVDFMIVSPQPTTVTYVNQQRWFREIVNIDDLTRRFAQTQPPAISALTERCKVWQGDRDIVLDAHLIAQTISANENPPSP